MLPTITEITDADDAAAILQAIDFVPDWPCPVRLFRVCGPHARGFFTVWKDGYELRLGRFWGRNVCTSDVRYLIDALARREGCTWLAARVGMIGRILVRRLGFTDRGDGMMVREVPNVFRR